MDGGFIKAFVIRLIAVGAVSALTENLLPEEGGASEAARKLLALIAMLVLLLPFEELISCA